MLVRLVTVSYQFPDFPHPFSFVLLHVSFAFRAWRCLHIVSAYHYLGICMHVRPFICARAHLFDHPGSGAHFFDLLLVVVL
jgi:hypothetical protein